VKSARKDIESQLKTARAATERGATEVLATVASNLS
jgi:hypothetical protein